MRRGLAAYGIGLALTFGLLVTGSRDVGAATEADQLLAYEVLFEGIRITNELGSRPRVVVRHGAEPRWSPDGKRIAFLSDHGLPSSHECFGEEGNVPDCPLALFVVNPDGSGLRRLTKFDELDVFSQESFTWSPDSRRLAFVASSSYPDPDGPFHLHVVKVDGTGTRRLTRNPNDELWPAWSPVSERIAFEYGCCLRTINADGSGERRLTRASAKAPFWSPDGAWIAFSSTKSPSGLRIMSTDSGRDRLLARIRVQSGSWRPHPGTWSPDSRVLAFNGRGLETVRVDGTNRRRLDARGVFPTWSPDGVTIAYMIDLHKGIWVIRPDGTDRRRLMSSGYLPQWRPHP
jgi:Tol biopolymer transport system component